MNAQFNIGQRVHTAAGLSGTVLQTYTPAYEQGPMAVVAFDGATDKPEHVRADQLRPGNAPPRPWLGPTLAADTPEPDGEAAAKLRAARRLWPEYVRARAAYVDALALADYPNARAAFEAMLGPYKGLHDLLGATPASADAGEHGDIPGKPGLPITFEP